ncbi:MAG TPA: prenyltransferase/squalene oxidase repeat-containing protein [Planctomycetaceae bacterium]|jgi:hypothetical protein|nr:prenyltransferase/squalene oxidase repeat-containing protein [Planctomycetaceae bacterium]
MLQVARLAAKLLQEASPRVIEFLRTQHQPDGGFADRSGRSDLYYTVFGLEGLLALQHPLPIEDVFRYVSSFGDGRDLDLIHLACLARCWSILPAEMQAGCPRDAMLSRVESCRSADGGYDAQPNRATGSLYSTFMVVGAYQDLKHTVPESARLVEFILGLRDPARGFQQSRELPISLVPITAGAVALLRQLTGTPIDPTVRDWLLSCLDPQGGFRPFSDAPVPDLLSTATALHALSAAGLELDVFKEPCLDFIDSLWTNRGGFYGYWDDTHVDCEYTYYALLALGHLSL